MEIKASTSPPGKDISPSIGHTEPLSVPQTGALDQKVPQSALPSSLCSTAPTPQDIRNYVLDACGLSQDAQDPGRDQSNMGVTTEER